MQRGLLGGHAVVPTLEELGNLTCTNQKDLLRRDGIEVGGVRCANEKETYGGKLPLLLVFD